MRPQRVPQSRRGGKVWAAAIGATVVGYAAGQGLNLLAQTFRVPVVVRELGLAGYGTLVLLTTLSVFFTVLGLGITDHARLELLADSDHGRPTFPRTRRLCRAFTGIILALMLVWLLVRLVMLYASSRPLGDFVAAEGVVLFLVLVGSLSLWLSPNLAVLEVDGSTGLSNFLKGLGAPIGLLLTVVAFGLSSSVGVAAIAWAIGLACPYAIALALVRVRYRTIYYENFDDEGTRDIRRSTERPSYGLALVPLVAFLATGLDPFIVNGLMSAEDVSAYSVANRLGALILVLSAAMRPLIWTWMGRERLHASPQLARRNLLMALGAMTVGTAPVAAALVVVGPVVARLLAGAEISAPRSLYLGFAISGLFAALFSVCQASLSGSTGRRTLFWLSIFVALFNIGLSVILCLRTGLAGPAWAGAIANSVAVLFCLVLAWHKPERLADAKPRTVGQHESADE